METHTLHLGELHANEHTTAHSTVLAADTKRLHIAHELHRASDGAIAARQELMFLTVNLSTRRSVPWPAETLAGLQAAQGAHALIRPAWVGRRVAMPERPPA